MSPPPRPPRNAFLTALWYENPIFRQILGICSTLAATNLLINTLFMCAGLTFVAVMSSVTVSALRAYTPQRIRMMVQTLIIASYTILVDVALKAYAPLVSKALGPYVGLILTNCIIMGRCEAFAGRNTVKASLFDALGSGLGYSLLLIAIAVPRELLGFGTFAGHDLLGRGWTAWTIMVMPSGAFFMLGLYIWLARSIQRLPEPKKP
ncbi:MAG: Rnf-Nqr domain containing protein [Planctomycetota bacterium]